MLINLIRFYQKYLSTAKKPTCRFTPTCSEYATQAIQEHGSLEGLWLSIKRILKCNPFGPWGYDPIPRKVSRETIS